MKTREQQQKQASMYIYKKKSQKKQAEKANKTKMEIRENA